MGLHNCDLLLSRFRILRHKFRQFAWVPPRRGNMSGSGPNPDEHFSAARKGLVRQICVACAWFVTIGICGTIEVARLNAAIGGPVGALGWFAHWNPDSTLCFLVLLHLPPLLWYGIRHASLTIRMRRSATPNASPVRFRIIRDLNGRKGLTSCGLFLLSFLCSASIGFRDVEIRGRWNTRDPRIVRFCSLPPAYHDEFSYLLQAHTFLAGRVAWPPMTIRPDLFHQMHVLNEPTTASRYFPSTGLWLAPFVKLGNPWLGQWLAGSISCVFFYRSLLKLLPNGWALAGGLAIAVSPGLAVFSNLLLAHHPTMMCLSVFLWSMLRFMNLPSACDASIAGVSLALAMLGRPMTAAGFALPFGVWLLVSFLRTTVGNKSKESVSPISFRLLLAMSLPIVAGFLVLGAMNRQITGQWTRSAYQYYTDTWTPSHRFGFHNAEIGARMAGPHVLKAYDQWATNLTVSKALENVGNRLVASFQWTMGIGALLFLLIAAIPECIPRSGGTLRPGLLLCSVLCLHLLHIPYWYDGILHWHYVFETAPLLLMLSTVGLKNSFEVLRPLVGPRCTSMWLLALVMSSLLPNWLNADSFWGPSRVSLAVGEQSYSRVRFEQFRRLVNSPGVRHPCLILVDEQGADPQLSFIVNPPDLEGDTLVCRKPSSDSEIVELQDAFPGREIYEFNPGTFELRAIR